MADEGGEVALESGEAVLATSGLVGFLLFLIVGEDFEKDFRVLAQDLQHLFPQFGVDRGGTGGEEGAGGEAEGEGDRQDPKSCKGCALGHCSVNL